ncbi:C-terminal binding protein [Phycisphaerales bacterium AB-hyl4]|uniref:C-terminal binding protein n=1 Tax=Natronomicrosphaera hydrolytica TaxID=3242702 RepID=A0ABV4U9Q9_9BACT
MPKRYKVVIPDFIVDALTPERDILGDMSDVFAYDANHEDELAGRIEDADAIMLYHNLSLTRKTLGRLNQCKLIVRCGVGVDNVDHAYARTRGIPVANVPDYGTEEVADSALAMALTLARGVHPLNSMIRDGRDPYSYTQVVPLQRLRGAVFGVVGMGRIGTAAALRAKAFGMDVVFHDPYVADGCDKAVGCRRVDRLEDLLEQAYILSLHCPLTDETRHLINGTTLGRMPRGGFLINTARGGVVDTALLSDALTSGQLAGAGIDVLVNEPPAADDPLVVVWRNPQHVAHHRLILNPHSAFYSEQGLRDMRVKGAGACRDVLLGKLPRNIIN